ncbi:MAG: hypothetical protein KF862_05570 [Chitinophagaceae bacterium]|nr:hypothetical protein [Chitinophagaceae bacterium]
MSVKRTMGIIVSVVFVVIAGFIFILYATIKTKSTSLRKYEPFKEWVGKSVVLNKEAVLFKEKIPGNTNGEYPYMLMDSLHPRWQYMDEEKSAGNIEEIVAFPAGTALKLEKAIQYTNGVSGSSSPWIFGTVSSNGNTYKTGYQWGTRDLEKNFYQIEKCWKFHQAPWQDKTDTTFYALPTAEFW